MRAHFVDTLLARLDGEVACIWVTIAVRMEGTPSIEGLRAQLVGLHRAAPRLGDVWCESRGGWQARHRSDAELGASLEVSTQARSRAEIVERVIARRIELERDLGFLVGVHPLLDGGTLLSFQLHHAHGDARALGGLLRLMFGNPATVRASGLPRMSEANVLRAAARHPRASVTLLHPRTRMLATRAVALPRDGDEVGDPLLASAAFEVEGGARVHAGLFYAGLAVTAARWAPATSGRLRMRVPIDLSHHFAFAGPPANTCITVPLELELARLRGASAGSEVLDYVRGELARLVARGAIWPALLETLLVARVASRAQLRGGARPGLLAARRTNTLVATYVGALDDYFAAAPFTVTSALGHTPTWGASAFTLGGRLVVNVSAFAGLWSQDTLLRFRDELGDWLVAQGARCVERGP